MGIFAGFRGSAVAGLPEARGMTGTVASADRRLTLAILTTWGVLCALQYGGLPFGRYAWAVNLWAYQPVAVGLVLASLALSISAGSVRRSLIGALDRVNLRIGKNALIPLAAGAGAALLFWLLTGDDLSPDARVFGGAVMSGYDFIFPDMGATWIIFRLSWLALILDLPVFSLVRVASCLSGGTTVALLISMSRRGMLGPVRPFGLSTGLLLSAGLVRTFVGRVETYPFLLVAVAVFFFWLLCRMCASNVSVQDLCLHHGGLRVLSHSHRDGTGLAPVHAPHEDLHRRSKRTLRCGLGFKERWVFFAKAKKKHRLMMHIDSMGSLTGKRW